MAFEHLPCGTVFDGRLPPMDCEVCLATIFEPDGRIKVARGDKKPEHGWRKVGGSHRRRLHKEKQRKRRAGGRITPGKRQKVYERDGYKCVACGEDDIEKLTLDHKIPRSKGGSNRFENLQTMCGDCNSRKGNKLPEGARIRWPVNEISVPVVIEDRVQRLG